MSVKVSYRLNKVLARASLIRHPPESSLQVTQRREGNSLKSSINPPPHHSNKPLPLIISSLPSPNYSSLINDRLYKSIKTLCGLIWDDLFTNWKFRFDSDPQLYDLQPSCTLSFSALYSISLRRNNTIVFSKLNKPPSQISPLSLLSNPPTQMGFSINKPLRGLNRGFTVVNQWDTGKELNFGQVIITSISLSLTSLTTVPM